MKGQCYFTANYICAEILLLIIQQKYVILLYVITSHFKLIWPRIHNSPDPITIFIDVFHFCLNPFRHHISRNPV